MALTYEPIATTTLGSSQSSVTFSSIPSTYTDIVVTISSGGDANVALYARFNSDSGNNYGRSYFYGNASGTASVRNTSIAGALIGIINAGSTIRSLTMAHIQDYSNTTTYKGVISQTTSDGAASYLQTLSWLNTAAISTIQILTFTDNMIAGTQITLYGIKAA